MAEVVEERLQGRPGDLELGRGEIEPSRDIVGADEVGGLRSHAPNRTATDG